MRRCEALADAAAAPLAALASGVPILADKPAALAATPAASTRLTKERRLSVAALELVRHSFGPAPLLHDEEFILVPGREVLIRFKKGSGSPNRRLPRPCSTHLPGC